MNCRSMKKKKCKIYPIVVSSDKKYPTQKPLKLMKELVNLHSLKGQVVLDSFMGSGTTGISCLELDRDFIGIELDDKYFEIAKKRIDECQKNMKNDLFFAD